MELRVLRYFLEVAREENITKAANYLHISQPTLSRQLKDLEEELGKKLFTRSNHNIKLTDEGMLLKKRAEDIIDMVDKTTDEFKALDEFVGGDIHIGCPESQGMDIVIKIAKTLQIQYPNVRFHFYSSGTDAVTQRLDNGLIDIAIIVQNVDLTKYNYLVLPHQDCWGILTKKNDALASKQFVTVNDLMRLPLICSRQGLEDILLDWFKGAESKMNIVATYDLLYNTGHMVRNDLGYPLGFDHILNTDDNSDLCFIPLEPKLNSPMHVIWRKYQVFTPAAQLFLDELKSKLTPQ